MKALSTLPRELILRLVLVGGVGFLAVGFSVPEPSVFVAVARPPFQTNPHLPYASIDRLHLRYFRTIGRRFEIPRRIVNETLGYPLFFASIATIGLFVIRNWVISAWFELRGARLALEQAQKTHSEELKEKAAQPLRESNETDSGKKPPHVLITIPGLNTDGLRMFEFGKAVKKEYEAKSARPLTLVHIPHSIPIHHVVLRFAISTTPEMIGLRLSKEIADHPNSKISVICHSFGTYCFGRALENFPAITLDNVVHVGAVLRRDFPWDRYVDKNGNPPRIRGRILNIVRSGDLIQWLAFWVGGQSGGKGYIRVVDGMVENLEKPGGHTAYHPDDIKDVTNFLLA